MNFERFKTRLRDFDALRENDQIERGVVDRVEPEFADSWPHGMHDRLHNELLNSNIRRPYRHQAQAIELSLQGNDVVLESPTASGKTLAFTVPMLDTLLREPDSHALMIYPMKALAFDQREQIRQLCEPLGIESWPYDGDVDAEIRNVIRTSPPEILLTNPEYLNLSFLAYCDKWEHFLSKLKFVVIDEMHEYRGYFGGNMSLLLRRFFLKLHRLGANPRVFLSTATNANPAEHAQNLTGRDVKVVSARDALRPRRHFLFINPDLPDYQYWRIFQLRIENVAMAILEAGLQALIFCPTKRFLEAIYRNCKRRAEENGDNPSLLTPFHADMRPDVRQKIQQDIKDSKIRVIFTTNSLELGLDIGGLDGVVLAGFPSNIMSAWQRIGRAGRNWDRDAFVLFFAQDDPIDQFFVDNINAFLNRPFDHLIVDPRNPELIASHIPSLITETGGKLSEGDRSILGEEFYEEAKKKGGKPIKGYRPQRSLTIRGNFGRSYKLKSGSEELGQISEMRRFREAFIGGIFPFMGRKYRVHAHEADAIILVPLSEAEMHLRTEGGFYTMLHTDQIHDGFQNETAELDIIHGTLNIQMNFTGYKEVDERTGEQRGEHVPSNDALFQNNLHAVWFNIPTSTDNVKGVGALENLLRVGAMFVVPSDRFDTSTWSKIKDGVTIYYYENYTGGIGVARKFFQEWNTALEKGIDIAENCDCRSGCQNCIEPPKSWNFSGAEIDKVAGIALSENLLHDGTDPDYKFRDGVWSPL